MSAMIHNNNTNFTQPELCEEVKINYHILFLDVITHRDSDKEILVLIGDSNALACLERIHIYNMVVAPDLVGGVDDTKMRCICPYDCLESSIPVNTSDFPWSFVNGLFSITMPLICMNLL